ncbi:hypothetical protein [Haliea sp.]|uniref:hypothetical protein n=1 Tax=Haliea sp. TaxID=1932666 RepID=UPI00257EC7D0|nr:hypothetical protein [Haliea sp.]
MKALRSSSAGWHCLRAPPSLREIQARLRDLLSTAFRALLFVMEVIVLPAGNVCEDTNYSTIAAF